MDYLLGLKGFVNSNNVIDIFTLNYDSVVETYCEKENINYSDGFELKWDFNNFEKIKKGNRLYKLHGSLYWFKTENNKLVKIPIKHCNTDGITYYSYFFALLVERYRILGTTLSFLEDALGALVSFVQCIVNRFFRPRSFVSRLTQATMSIFSSQPTLRLKTT